MPTPPQQQARPNPLPGKITHAGVRKAAAQPKKPEQPKEDDIFASMGLSAKPKFSHTSNPPPSGGLLRTTVGRTRAEAAPVPSALSAAAADVGGDAGSDWGDDSDLDDLLDD